MFGLTGEAASAQAVFAHTAERLGVDPRELAVTEPDEALHGNRIGQVLCTVQALAAAAVLQEALGDRRIVAGYSVGEVAAWGVAGAWDMASTVDAVLARAAAMDEVSPAGDGLLFIRGMPRKGIEQICSAYDVAVAIVNPQDAFVLGGARGALLSAADEARRRGATRVAAIPVQVASHTPRLAAATAIFRRQTNLIGCRFPLSAGTRLISGIDGALVVEPQEGLAKLAAQISQTVLWSECLQSCIEGGATAFLELGPGSALSRMAADAYPSVPARSLDDFSSIRGAVSWLERYASI